MKNQAKYCRSVVIKLHNYICIWRKTQGKIIQVLKRQNIGRRKEREHHRNDSTLKITLNEFITIIRMSSSRPFFLNFFHAKTTEIIVKLKYHVGF